MIKEGKTTMWIDLNTKKELDKLKIIDRETYESVIKRLLAFYLNYNDPPEPIVPPFSHSNQGGSKEEKKVMKW